MTSSNSHRKQHLLATLLGLSTLLGGAHAAQTVCLDKVANGLTILFTNDKIWDATGDGFVADTGVSTTAGNIHGANTSFATPLDWQAFRTNAIHTFDTPDCIKRIFGDSKNWEKMYVDSREKILQKLADKSSLPLLNLASLPDAACSIFFEKAHAAAAGPPNAPYQPTVAQFANFHPACWPTNPAHITYWTPAMVQKIPQAVFNDARAGALIKSPISGGKRLYTALTPVQAKNFTTEPERCGLIEGEDVINYIGNNLPKTAYYNACVRKMDWLWEGAAAPAFLNDQNKVRNFFKSLDEKIFSTVEKDFNSLVRKYITPQQAVHFDSDDKTEFRCSNISLNDLYAASLAKVDKDCMAGFLKYHGNAQVNFGPILGKFSENIFSAIHPADFNAIFRVLAVPENSRYLKAQHWATLLALPSACSYITAPPQNNNLDWNRFPEIKADCFLAMSEAIRKDILSKDVGIKKLDVQLLARLEKEQIKAEELVTISKKRPELLKHLGVDLPASSDIHPCTQYSLSNYMDQKDVKAVLDNSNASCIRSISGLEELNASNENNDFWRKLPRTLFAIMDLSELTALKQLPADFWSAMKPNVFEILATPANCSEFTSEVFGKINPEALKSLHADCFRSLKADLSAAQTQKLEKSILEIVDVKTWARIAKHVAQLKPDQLAAVSSKVTDPKKQAATLFTADTVKSFSPEQIKALSAVVLSVLPDAAWKGFDSAERYKALSPESLTKVTLSQLKEVPADILLETTAAQAARLGEGVKDPNQHPKKAFTKEMLAKMKDKAAADLLSSATRLSVTKTLVVGSLLMLVFFFIAN